MALRLVGVDFTVNQSKVLHYSISERTLTYNLLSLSIKFQLRSFIEWCSDLILISIYTRLLFEGGGGGEISAGKITVRCEGRGNSWRENTATHVTLSSGKTLEAATYDVNLWREKLPFAENPQEIAGYTCL